MESRALPVPDGLDGTRADAALAKMLGFSRTFAADVVDAGGVSMDGRLVGKSDRLRGGAWLEVSWSPKEEPRIEAVAVPDLGIVYDDADLDQLRDPFDFRAAGAGQVVGAERLRLAHHGGAADDVFLHDQTPRWRRGLNGRSCCILR